MACAVADRTAFVFAGGSSLGAIQVGMLEALLAQGWRADLVVGASVGAINAAYFAGDPTPQGVARLADIWRGMRRADVFPTPALRSLMRLLSRSEHLIDPGALTRLLERHLPYQRLEQARLPCCIVATDLLAGVEVRLREGPLIPALLASAAIPGVFPAVNIGGRFVVDGGVASHTPLSAAVALGATRLVVLPTGYACALAAPPRSAVAMAMHALNILISRQVSDAVRRYRTEVEVVVVPPLCPLNASPVDFAGGGALIDRARRSTEAWLRDGESMSDGVPHQLPPHAHHVAGGTYGPLWLQSQE